MVGVGCTAVLLIILLFVLLWKNHYCNKLICCKKIRFYRELNRHLRHQAQLDQAHRQQQEAAALMPSHDNLVEVDLNAANPEEHEKPPSCCCLFFRKCCKSNLNSHQHV